MPSTSPPDTSIAAFHDLDASTEASWEDRILGALQERPRTAAWLAEDLVESYHDVERRVSTLYRKGFLGRGSKVKNPSGRWAYEMHVTDAARAYLRGDAPAPKERVTRQGLVAAVIRAARVVADLDEDAVDLRHALAALDAYDAPERPRKAEPRPEPYGSERRRRRVLEGVWVRQDGSEVPVEDMTDHHLAGAIRWLHRNGARVGSPELDVLMKEEAHRLLLRGSVSS